MNKRVAALLRPFWFVEEKVSDAERIRALEAKVARLEAENRTLKGNIQSEVPDFMDEA